MILELLLVASIGFLGSFGHCVAMCGPTTVAFSLAKHRNESSVLFQMGLNLGRLMSYGIVGAAIGGVGSVLLAGGQMAGVGSGLRQAMAVLTGISLIWFGMLQVAPNFLPRIPLLHPLQGGLHRRLNAWMEGMSQYSQWWVSIALGGIWGCIPCGFLYAAQIKAAEAGSWWLGGLTTIAFGIGTLPAMMSIGIVGARLGRDRREQLYRVGGWITVTVGLLTLLRSDAMVDFTGFGAIALLVLAAIARPIAGLWPSPRRHRRLLGVGAFVLAAAHTLHSLDHFLRWNPAAIAFLIPQHQIGMWFGITALLMMLPLAVTSTDGWQTRLGRNWRRLHLLVTPLFLLAIAHTILLGSHFLGGFDWTLSNLVVSAALAIAALLVWLIRRRFIWNLFSLQKYYVIPKE